MKLTGNDVAVVARLLGLESDPPFLRLASQHQPFEGPPLQGDGRDCAALAGPHGPPAPRTRNELIGFNHLLRVTMAPPPTLRAIEQGRIANPGVITIAQLAVELGVTLDDLVVGSSG